MYIPQKLMVRVQRNNDEIPLAYVTYLNEKQKLMKSVSWINWGNDFLGEFDNIPLSGFKLEKVVKRSSDWFGTGKTMFRVIHPNNFIFEISSNNLLEIIINVKMDEGIILEPCILAWEGAELALIPTNTELYTNTSKLTEDVNSGNVKPSELIVGETYKNRNGKLYFYHGKFLHLISSEEILKPYDRSYGYYDRTIRSKGKKKIKLHFDYIHIFSIKDVKYLESMTSPKMFESDVKIESKISVDELDSAIDNHNKYSQKFYISNDRMNDIENAIEEFKKQRWLGRNDEIAQYDHEFEIDMKKFNSHKGKKK